MNCSASPSTSRRGWARNALLGVLALVLGSLIVAPLLVPAAIYYSFRPTADLRALKAGVGQSMGGELEREIELAVRPPAFTLVRLGALCGDLPAEARTALRAIHSAEVGLYQVAPGPRSGRRAGLLTAVDQAMIKRGWERIVGVVDGPTVVAVFAPHNLRSNRDLSLAVMVCEGSQVVLASVRGDPEILAELAFEQARQHSRRALVSAR